VTRIVEWHDADIVTDEESFLTLLQALARDRADEVGNGAIRPSPPTSAGANGWENGMIEAYLDRAHGRG